VMNFEDLSAFVAVEKLRSFSKAAVQLRVAQLSLSKRVQRLELRRGNQDEKSASIKVRRMARAGGWRA